MFKSDAMLICLTSNNIIIFVISVIDGISFPTSVGQTLASTHSAGMADTNGNSYTPFSTESVLLNEQANSGGSAYSEPQVVSRQNYSIDNNNKNKQHISLYID